MKGQALYRRWRSQNFAELIAQEHVTHTLQNALRDGRLAHAYLFCGPRGTGKTSTARILAKAVNCLAEPAQRPCNECARCQAINEGRDLDLIEIDAASNRGIDEIRALRDKVAFAPNEGRYKIYVIDEVHMLTTEAFNALLKTLEEPPSHVVFVLATTEPHKIPATILSRCQRFDFRRIPLVDLNSKLERICEAEGIRIQPAAVEAIARRAGGSFRDAESLLDQLAAYGDEEITLERVQELLGGVSTAAVSNLAQAWIDNDLQAGLRLINKLIDEGTDARQLQLQLTEYLRGLLLLTVSGDEKLAGVAPEMAAEMRRQVVALPVGRLMEALRAISAAEAPRGEVRPQMPLELAFVGAVLQGRGDAGATVERPAARPAPVNRAPVQPQEAAQPRVQPAAEQPVQAQVEVKAEAPAPPAASKPTPAPDEPRPAEAPAVAADAEAAGVSIDAVRAKWQALHQELRVQGLGRIQGLLNSGHLVECVGTRVILDMDNSFARDRLMDEKSRRVVEDTLARLVGVTCQLECRMVDKNAPRRKGAEPPAEQPRPAQRAGTNAPAGPKAAPPSSLHEDSVIRYAVEDLGAQVKRVDEEDAKT